MLGTAGQEAAAIRVCVHMFGAKEVSVYLTVRAFPVAPGGRVRLIALCVGSWWESAPNIAQTTLAGV